MKWTKEKIKKLIELFPENSNKNLAEIFGVTIQSISTKAKILKIHKSENFNSYENKIKWTDEYEKKLINLYESCTNEYLATIFNTSIKSIKSKAGKLKLIKSKEFISEHNKELIWTEEMISVLKKMYINTKNEDIAKFFNTSIKSITCKANKLDLHKSKEFKSYLIGERNKLVGRNLTIETLKTIAKEYKTRGEFQLRDPSAYTTSRLSGYMDEICAHMIKQNYSIPQLILNYIIKNLIDENILYNTRKIIKPYELDVYSEKYKLAFEYDGKGWHKNNKNDLIKDMLCNSAKIKMIRIKERSRKYIDDVKIQLIENLNIINIQTDKNINSKDIMNIEEKDIYNYINEFYLDKEKIIKTISKYTNYHDFIINEHSLYQKLKKNKCLEKYTLHLTKKSK